MTFSDNTKIDRQPTFEKRGLGKTHPDIVTGTSFSKREYEIFSKLMGDIEKGRIPMIGTCLCGAVPLRKAVLIFAMIDCLTSTCFCYSFPDKTAIYKENQLYDHHYYNHDDHWESYFASKGPNNRYRNDAINKENKYLKILWAIPLVLYFIFALIGVIGAYKRKAKMVRFYAYAAISWPFVYVTAMLLFAHYNYSILEFTLSLICIIIYAWWKFLISWNCAKWFERGYTADEIPGGGQGIFDDQALSGLKEHLDGPDEPAE